jgi:hypothetical protein
LPPHLAYIKQRLKRTWKTYGWKVGDQYSRYISRISVVLCYTHVGTLLVYP